MAAVSAEGSTVCVLMRRLNSSCSRSIALVVRADLHWLSGNRVKVNSRSPASSKLSATARHFSRHLRMNDLRRTPVDHVVVIGRNLLMQTFRSMRQKVAVLVYGAALHQHGGPHQAERFLQSRRTVDDDEA